jgi:hypothetical protein
MEGRPTRWRPGHPEGRRPADAGGPRPGRDKWRGPATVRERGGGRLCSPARAGGVDGGARGGTLGEPADGLCHRERQPQASAPSAGGNFRSDATSAGAGAEPCAVSSCTAKAPETARRATASGEQLPEPAPGPRRAAMQADGRRLRPRTAARVRALGRGPRPAPRCTPKAPGTAPEWGCLRGTTTTARARAEPRRDAGQKAADGRDAKSSALVHRYRTGITRISESSDAPSSPP